MIVAIDGPSGAGKSTVAKAAAKRLGFSCLDTGAMYRAIAWKALADGVSFDDAEALGAIARDNGEVYIYYASSDTSLHVASTTIERLTDYVFGTPSDPLRSVDCVKQRCELIRKNLELLGK